jgi:hypothetical protein
MVDRRAAIIAENKKTRWKTAQAAMVRMKKGRAGLHHLFGQICNGAPNWGGVAILCGAAPLQNQPSGRRAGSSLHAEK